jgi:hypothetical protein
MSGQDLPHPPSQHSLTPQPQLRLPLQPQPQPRLHPLHPSRSSSEGGAVAVQNFDREIYIFRGRWIYGRTVYTETLYVV